MLRTNIGLVWTGSLGNPTLKEGTQVATKNKYLVLGNLNFFASHVMFISNTTVNGLTKADQIFCHNNKYQSLGPNEWQISTFSIVFYFIH